jgi:hypothetical protein
LAVPVSSRAGDDVTPGQEEAFMRDYLQMQSGPREMAVAVWYAEPIWEVMGEERFASINEEEKNELLFVQKMLRPFTVMLVVHGRPDGRGGVRFSGEKWMRKHATLVGLDGKKYKPLTPKNWPSGLDVLLQAVRFGAMSEGAFSSANNMHFIVFPNTDKDGKVIVDYRYPGSVSLRLGRSTLIWQTPIRTGPQKRAL